MSTTTTIIITAGLDLAFVPGLLAQWLRWPVPAGYLAAGGVIVGGKALAAYGIALAFVHA